jgi:transposase-like protein
VTEQKKRLTPKQKKALEMLTCGEAYSYGAIAAAVGVTPQQLWNWRTQPQFELFQTELKKLENLKWLATVDAAREAAFQLCQDKNQRMVEFVLKNEGYNPTQKVEADLHSDINITIEE